MPTFNLTRHTLNILSIHLVSDGLYDLRTRHGGLEKRGQPQDGEFAVVKPEEAIGVVQPLLQELPGDAFRGIRQVHLLERLEKQRWIVVNSRDHHLQTHGSSIAERKKCGQLRHDEEARVTLPMPQKR